MILAYTHFDVDTNVLKGFALEFRELLPATPTPQVLRPRTSANAANIQSVLANTPDEPFFFFGKGQQTPGSLLGQDQQAALHQHNLNLLANRLVFAVCCYGIGTLGAATQHGATVLGYDGLLLFSRTAPLVFESEDCILAGAKTLLAGKTAQDAYQDTYNAYQSVAQRLLQGSFHEQMMAQRIFQPNQQALRLAGNANRTL